jgi:hypothetical protein
MMSIEKKPLYTRHNVSKQAAHEIDKKRNSTHNIVCRRRRLRRGEKKADKETLDVYRAVSFLFLPFSHKMKLDFWYCYQFHTHTNII